VSHRKDALQCTSPALRQTNLTRATVSISQNEPDVSLVLLRLEIEIAGKQLELLKEMVPRLDRVAILAARQVWPLFSSAQNDAAKKLAIDLTYVDMASPDTADAAMREAVSAGAHAGVLRGTPFFSSVQRKMIVDVAAEHHLPISFESREFVEQGGLVSYAADVPDLYRWRRDTSRASSAAQRPAICQSSRQLNSS